MPRSLVDRLAVASVVAIQVVACQSATKPSSPTSVMTGTWTGTASDTSGAGQMTWQIVQAGAAISGTFTMIDATTNVAGRGSVNGSMSGGSIHFSLIVPQGGFDGPYASCGADVTGDATASALSITGTYSGTNSCTGAVASGQFTLARS